MLLQQTIVTLKQIKRGGMVKALELRMEMPDSQSLPFEVWLGLMVDCQLTWQSDKRRQTKLR